MSSLFKIIFNTLVILCTIFTPLVAQGGVDLNGDADYVTIADDDSLDFGTDIPISMAVWVNIEGTGYQDLYSKMAYNSADGWRFFYNDASNAMSVVVHDGDGNQYCTITGDTDLSGKGLTHVVLVMTRNASCTVNDVDIYVDGVAESLSDPADSTTFANNVTNTLSAYIGTLGPSDFLNGQIYEAALWNTLLTEADVLQLYNGGLKRMPLQIKPDNLVSYWALDDNPSGAGTISGLTFKDMAGVNDGTGVDADNDSDTIAETFLSYP